MLLENNVQEHALDLNSIALIPSSSCGECEFQYPTLVVAMELKAMRIN